MLKFFRSAPSADEVTPADARQLAHEGSAQIIDIREGWEWDNGRAAGARHIPMGDLPGRLNALPRYREILLICASGNRSLRAARFLQQQGFSARSVAGGTAAWARNGFEIQR